MLSQQFLVGTSTDIGSQLSFLVKRMFTRADQNVEFSLLVAVAKQLFPLALQMEYSSCALILQSCQQVLRLYIFPPAFSLNLSQALLKMAFISSYTLAHLSLDQAHWK